MGLRDTIFGRTKQVQPKLDNLFALPSAALTLETQLDLVPSGQGGLCFKAGSGESSLSSDQDIIALLDFQIQIAAMEAVGNVNTALDTALLFIENYIYGRLHFYEIIFIHFLCD